MNMQPMINKLTVKSPEREQGQKTNVDAISSDETTQQRKLRTRTNGAKAFEVASDMEGPLADLRRVARSLRLLVSVEDIEPDVSDILCLLANMAEDSAERAEHLRAKIFHATWGYRFPPASTPSKDPWDAELIARMEVTLREQKAARRYVDKTKTQGGRRESTAIPVQKAH